MFQTLTKNSLLKLFAKSLRLACRRSSPWKDSGSTQNMKETHEKARLQMMRHFMRSLKKFATLKHFLAVFELTQSLKTRKFMYSVLSVLYTFRNSWACISHKMHIKCIRFDCCPFTDLTVIYFWFFDVQQTCEIKSQLNKVRDPSVDTIDTIESCYSLYTRNTRKS